MCVRERGREREEGGRREKGRERKEGAREEERGRRKTGEIDGEDGEGGRERDKETVSRWRKGELERGRVR